MPEILVKNLICRYSKDKPKVLEVPELKLESGKLYFVLGKSGIGKSTLIETLGLMEQTFEDTSSLTFNVSKTSIPDLIRLNDDVRISEFRKKNFAFIFQSTNLFSHLTLGENAMMPCWIDDSIEKAGVEQIEQKVTDLIKSLLPNLWLKYEDKCKDLMITNISGGQKQRLAFIRALATPFKILFGDEPTGNLDKKKADDLIEALLEEIKGKEKKLACLVSHDIDLAIQHADEIIGLSESSDNSSQMAYGTITGENVYFRDNKKWKNQSGKTFNEESLKDELFNLLK
ncbi:MAG: hypothetical protein CL823_05685 [Crocinitomicaceae bacterium]|nr:hypothetical protein [Crocinitomicaceae bacterium]|tara:strand:- start:1703 stop:2560 length:858 start_codon:yes stop_codon:yes gene_type:complete